MERIGRPPVLGQDADESRVELVRGAVEGCASSSEKWKMDFGTLLADRQGVDAFRAYLEKEATDRLGSRLMTMWLIYEGIRNDQKQRRDNEYVVHLLKVGKTMINTYFPDAENVAYGAEPIRAAFSQLKKSMTRSNAEQLSKAFETSQREVRDNLEKHFYPAFIDSENYKHGYLPAIDEHKMMPPPSSGLTAEALSRTVHSRARSSENFPYNPNRVYYAPYGSHNNSEYASQSSDTGCTSDAASFTTETTDEDPRMFKRRNKMHQNLHLKVNRTEKRKTFARDRGVYHDRFIEESINPTDTQMAEKHPATFFKILRAKLAPIAAAQEREERQAASAEREDVDNEAILSEHIDRTLKSGAHSPTPRLAIVDEVRHSHATASVKSGENPTKPSNAATTNTNATSDTTCYGSLPAFGRETQIDTHSKKFGPLYGQRPQSQQLYPIVGEWLTNNQPSKPKTRARTAGPPKTNANHQFNRYNGNPYGYQSNSGKVRVNHQRHHGEQRGHASAVSIDSGLSSQLAGDLENHSEMELRGVKGRLIQEIEGNVTTTLVYQYNNEKYKIKVPGRPPTLGSFRSKFHLNTGSYRYFFKSCDVVAPQLEGESGTWIEITEPNEPLPLFKTNLDEMIVEAKVMDGHQK